MAKKNICSNNKIKDKKTKYTSSIAHTGDNVKIEFSSNCNDGYFGITELTLIYCNKDSGDCVEGDYT